MHEVLVNRLGGLSLPRKSVVRLTDRPDMTLNVYRGRKTTIQQLSDHWKFQIFTRFIGVDWILFYEDCFHHKIYRRPEIKINQDQIIIWGKHLVG